MTKDNIELIKSFVQAVLPLLIFIFVVVIFIFYRKRIEVFFSKITKIRGKIAGQEFETEIRERSSEQIEDKPNQSINQSAIEEKKPVEDSLHHVWAAYRSKDFEKARQIFEQVQQKELDPKKKIVNEIFHFYLKSINGDTNAIGELEKYAVTIKYDEEKLEAYEYLGFIHNHSRAYEKAIKEYETAMELAITEEKKSNLTGYISDCYYDLGNFKEAEEVILNLLKKLTEDKSKCISLKNLGEFYNKRKMPFLRAITLEKALEYEPNNIDILFKLAYSYSESNLKAIAILHYKTLLFFNSKADYARNNLAVAYNHFGINFKANKEYRLSLAQGNSLAGGNLASNLISGGFSDEAKEVIDQAKEIVNYDNLVNEALDDLNKKSKIEDEKENEIIESAKRQERFFKKFYERNAAALFEFEKITGDWIVKDGVTVENIQNQLNNLNVSWYEGEVKIELSGNFTNFTSQNIVYIDKDPKFTVLRRTSKGFAYIDENIREIDILIFIENSHEIKELTIKKVFK